MTEEISANERRYLEAKASYGSKPPKSSVTDLLHDRGLVHGKWEENARLSWYFQLVLMSGANWKELSNSQRVALQMIVHKIGRILSGDMNYRDHWDDIIGYAKLGLEGEQARGEQPESTNTSAP
jgi:hypothetical protein